MKIIKICFTFVAFLMLETVQGQTVTQDSLSRFLLKNQSVVHEMVTSYDSFINWKSILGTLGGLAFLLGVAWASFLKEWLSAYIKKKVEEAADNIINLKATPILVVSSDGGKTNNDEFLRDFFEAKKFVKTKFIRVKDKFVPVNDFRYKLVFINNDDGLVAQSVVEQYGANGVPIFYFGKSGSWDFTISSPEINREINLANSRAQIYGNLMSSLQFLSLIKPDVKNV